MEKVTFIHRFNLSRRIFYKITVFIQWVLWKNNIHWHNKFFDECTPNFSCCINKYPVGSIERFWLGQIAKGLENKETIIHFDKDIN